MAKAYDSDTVASTLIYAFHLLAKHPVHLRKLQQEVDGIDISNSKALQVLEHLDGVLKETLRLFPAVPTGGLRKTPSGGAYICGRWVPGGTTICAPRYSIFRRRS